MDEINITYIHIPKNAGTFVKQFMAIGNDKHLNACDKEREIKGDCSHLHITYLEHKNDDINYFTIIRNPYDRFYSIYEYDKEFLKKIFNKDIFENFETFLEYFYKNPNEIYKHKHLYPQSEYLINKNKKINEEIDILLFEELPINLKKYFEKKRIGYHIHKLNKLINQGNYTKKHLFTEIEKKKIQHIYQNDFKLLNYFF
jgi:hypothetical protein